MYRIFKQYNLWLSGKIKYLKGLENLYINKLSIFHSHY